MSHTHPYDKSECGHTGVSLSGGDAGYMINSKQNVIVTQSGDGQFMMMRTAETPATADYAKLNADQNARIAELQNGGMAFNAASEAAAKETANAYKLAYYKGTGGVLQRVVP